MTSTPVTTDTGEPSAQATRPKKWTDGRSGLIVPLILASFSTYLLVGLFVMHVPPGTDPPGPQFYPALLVICGYAVAIGLTVAYIRTPEYVDAGTHCAFSDWTSLAWAVGGFFVFAVLFDVLGWILAAAMLFWFIARAFGSARPLFDLSLALVVGSLTYLLFSVGLGLPLPSGLLGEW